MMITLLSLALAHADMAAEPCEQPHPTAVAPANGQVGVPVDTSILVEIQGDCGETDWEVVLKDPSGMIVSVVRVADLGDLVSWQPQDDLLPNATYSLDLIPQDEAGAVASSSFSTGEGFVAGMEGLPEIASLDLSTVDEGGVLARVEIVPAPDPDGLSFLHFEVNGEQSATRLVGPGVVLDMGGVFWPSEEEICVVAIQTDALGQQSESEPFCDSVPKDRNIFGCSSTASHASLAGLLVGLLLIGRRRR